MFRRVLPILALLTVASAQAQMKKLYPCERSGFFAITEDQARTDYCPTYMTAPAAPGIPKPCDYVKCTWYADFNAYVPSYYQCPEDRDYVGDANPVDFYIFDQAAQSCVCKMPVDGMPCIPPPNPGGGQ